jgi:Sulfotransferase family
MKLDRPVLVTGTPRSGKSCVTHLLNHLDEFTRVSEPLMIWETGMGSRPDDRRDPSEATDAVRGAILRGCAAMIADQPGTRYLDDLAYHALRVPFVHALMPEAKIIHMIRPPEDAIAEMAYGWTYRDSVASVIKRRRQAVRMTSLPRHGLRYLRNQFLQRFKGRRATWGPRVPGMSEFSAGHQTHEIAAYQWMKMVQTAMDDLAKLPTESWLEVRFDRLLADPRREAARIGAFCQVDDVDRLVQCADRFIDPQIRYPRRVELTDVQWADVDRLIGPLQRRLSGEGPATAPSES